MKSNQAAFYCPTNLGKGKWSLLLCNSIPNDRNLSMVESDFQLYSIINLKKTKKRKKEKKRPRWFYVIIRSYKWCFFMLCTHHSFVKLVCSLWNTVPLNKIVRCWRVQKRIAMLKRWKTVFYSLNLNWNCLEKRKDDVERWGCTAGRGHVSCGLNALTCRNTKWDLRRVSRLPRLQVRYLRPKSRSPVVLPTSRVELCDYCLHVYKRVLHLKQNSTQENVPSSNGRGGFCSPTHQQPQCQRCFSFSEPPTCQMPSPSCFCKEVIRASWHHRSLFLSSQVFSAYVFILNFY